MTVTATAASPTGDTVTAAMQRCSSSAARVPLTGSLRIEVQAGTSAALDRVVALRVSASGLRLDGDFSDLVAPSTLTGAFNVQWDEDDTTQSLRVTTVGTEELQFLYGFGPNNVRPDRLRRVELSRRADFAAGRDPLVDELRQRGQRWRRHHPDEHGRSR